MSRDLGHTIVFALLLRWFLTIQPCTRNLLLLLVTQDLLTWAGLCTLLYSSQHVWVDNSTLGCCRLEAAFFLKGLWGFISHEPRKFQCGTCPMCWIVCLSPFELLAKIELMWLSAKTAFLAITMMKHAEEPHALSVSPLCLRWNPGAKDHLCHSLRGITEHLLKVLQSEHRHPPSTGHGPFAKFFCINNEVCTLGFLMTLLVELWITTKFTYVTGTCSTHPERPPRSVQFLRILVILQEDSARTDPLV